MRSDAGASPSGTGRILGIDILRSAVILGVIIYHLWGFTLNQHGLARTHTSLLRGVADQMEDADLLGTATSAGELLIHSAGGAIEWFMMLSGMALTLVALRRREEVRPERFYRRRLGRLLPAYWAGLAIAVAALGLLAIPKTLIDGGSYLIQATQTGTHSYYDGDALLAALLLFPRGFSLDWAYAPPTVFWFVFLLVQYYLLFPLLFRLAERIGIVSLVAASFVVSIVGMTLFIWQVSSTYLWIPVLWCPFRLVEFTLGMALGYALFEPQGAARRALEGAPRTALCVAGGVALYTLGLVLVGELGYLRVFYHPFIAVGLTLISLPFVLKAPGLLESSPPGRLLAWIGPMSLAVLIMNEPFRYVDHYLWLKDLTWTPGWWVFIVAVYVPGTILLAVPLSRALGLTPPDYASQLWKGKLPAQSEMASAGRQSSSTLTRPS